VQLQRWFAEVVATEGEETASTAAAPADAAGCLSAGFAVDMVLVLPAANAVPHAPHIAVHPAADLPDLAQPNCLAAAAPHVHGQVAHSERHPQKLLLHTPLPSAQPAAVLRAAGGASWSHPAHGSANLAAAVAGAPGVPGHSIVQTALLALVLLQLLRAHQMCLHHLPPQNRHGLHMCAAQ
jgi:hypothetical protein